MPRGSTLVTFTGKGGASQAAAKATAGKAAIDLDAAAKAAELIEKAIAEVDVSEYESLADDPAFPVPPGWRLVIIPLKPPSKTKGGIILTDETNWEAEVLADIGYVASVGETAFKDPRFLGGPAWCKRGDWVNYGRLAGKDIIFIDKDGNKHRVHTCNDRDVIVRVPDPNRVKWR